LRKAYTSTSDTELLTNLLENNKVAHNLVFSRPWKQVNATEWNLEPTLNEQCFGDISKDVKFIFLGHTPIGQLPVIIRSINHGKEIIYTYCDTTYAGRVANIKLHNGVVMVSAVYVEDQRYGDPCTNVIQHNDDVYYYTGDPKVGTVDTSGLHHNIVLCPIDQASSVLRNKPHLSSKYIQVKFVEKHKGIKTPVYTYA
jgi:hypothetical protein